VCVGYPFDKIRDKFGFCRVTFKRVIANKSTEKFSGVPYPMTLLNCLLSTWYLSHSESTAFSFYFASNFIWEEGHNIYPQIVVSVKAKKVAQFCQIMVEFSLSLAKSFLSSF